VANSNDKRNSDLIKLANIPQELRAPALWLQYYLTRDPKKPDKKPTKHPCVKYRTAEDRASNLQTLDHLLTRRPQEGFQRLVDKAEGLIFIDLDDVRNAETREIVDWAQQIVDSFDTYCEISASGKGLHLVCRGVLAEDFHIDPCKVEIYSGNTPNKLIAMTGNILGLGYSIRDCQEEASNLLARVKAETRIAPEPAPPSASSIEPVKDEWPEPISSSDFYGPLGDFVRLLEPETEADPAALYVQALAVVGNIIGRNAYCTVRDSRHFPNLFVGIVGPTSGARKGTGGDSVSTLGKTLDAQWHKESIASGISSGEYVVERVKDTDEEIAKQADPACAEPVAVKRLMVFEDELGFLLSSAKRESSTTAAVLRNAWDGKRLQVGAKNVGAIASNAHISLVGHITREELLTLLSDTMIKGGLVNRFLWICSKRIKLLPEGGNPLDYAPIAKRVTSAMAGLDATPIIRDDAARELWDSVYREIESVPRDGMFGKATCRGAAQALRLSLLFALLDGERIIRVPHLEAALAVWRYSEASARFIFGDFAGNADIELILAALKAGPKSQTDISALFNRHRSAEQIAALLDTLRTAGKVKFRDVTTLGRTARVWELA
jgi:hypothetical protein